MKSHNNEYIHKWLNNYSLNTQNVWREMDKVWDEIFSEKDINLNEKLNKFYSHEVWDLNAFLTSKDKIAQSHRKIMIDYIKNLSPQSLLDYGGGKGVLASMINKKLHINKIQIYEPYGPKKIGIFENSKYFDYVQNYSIITCIDVLEHVVNPIKDVEKISLFLEHDGEAIFANCFYPFIKCHLDENMWLRHLFPFVAWSYHLERKFTLKGARHISVYKKRIRYKKFRSIVRFSLQKNIFLKLIKIIGILINACLYIPFYFMLRIEAFWDKK